MPVSSLVRPFNDAYLLAYSDEHVFYEFNMFLWSAQLRTSGAQLCAPNPVDANHFNNALIEAFVVHLRNVIDFLYLDRPQPSDVVASDFCENGVWHPLISATLKTARVRVNKEIAHLTSARICGRPPSKGWDFTGISTELRPVMRLFVKNALPSRLSPKVSAVIG